MFSLSFVGHAYVFCILHVWATAGPMLIFSVVVSLRGLAGGHVPSFSLEFCLVCVTPFRSLNKTKRTWAFAGRKLDTLTPTECLFNIIFEGSSKAFQTFHEPFLKAFQRPFKGLSTTFQRHLSTVAQRQCRGLRPKPPNASHALHGLQAWQVQIRICLF